MWAKFDCGVQWKTAHRHMHNNITLIQQHLPYILIHCAWKCPHWYYSLPSVPFRIAHGCGLRHLSRSMQQQKFRSFSSSCFSVKNVPCDYLHFESNRWVQRAAAAAAARGVVPAPGKQACVGIGWKEKKKEKNSSSFTEICKQKTNGRI